MTADYADNSRSYAYSYDVAGNRLQEQVTIGITTTTTDWTYDPANRIDTMKVGSNPTDTFEYDANGNLIGAGGFTYTWDYANRLTTLNTGSVNHHYAYDGDNNRVQQTVGGVATDYLLDIQPELTLVLGETKSGSTTHYLHSPRGIHAVQDTSDDWFWMVQDGLGSVRAEMDVDRDVVASRANSPYGQPFDEVGTFAGTFGFAGEQIDQTGQSYNRARYYDPSLGVFTALDPFEGIWSQPMTLNGYSYVEGNPTNMIDPSGEFGVAGAVVGGLVGAAMGFIFGRWQSGTTYDLVTANLCGCERKMALQGKTRDQYVGQAQAVGAGLGAAIGAVSGAFAGSGAVAFLGAVLELYGKAEALWFGAKIIEDFRQDWDIDDWCNVSDFFFAMLDIGLGYGLQYVGGKLKGSTSDPSVRQPDLVSDAPQVRNRQNPHYTGDDIRSAGPSGPDPGASLRKRRTWYGNENQLEQDIINRAFNGDRQLYDAFVQLARRSLPEDTKMILRGSAVTGVGYKSGLPFDGRGPGTSDLDIALIGLEVMNMWDNETGFYVAGVNTRVLGDEAPNIASSELNELRMELQGMVQRPVNFQATTSWFLKLRQIVQPRSIQDSVFSRARFAPRYFTLVDKT